MIKDINIFEKLILHFLVFVITLAFSISALFLVFIIVKPLSYIFTWIFKNVTKIIESKKSWHHHLFKFILEINCGITLLSFIQMVTSHPISFSRVIIGYILLFWSVSGHLWLFENLLNIKIFNEGKKKITTDTCIRESICNGVNRDYVFSNAELDSGYYNDHISKKNLGVDIITSNCFQSRSDYWNSVTHKFSGNNPRSEKNLHNLILDENKN